MPNRRIYDQERHAQFATFSCCRRRRILDCDPLRDALLLALTVKLGERCVICSGCVLMPHHVHTIVWLEKPGALSQFIEAWKQTSSIRLKWMLRGVAPKYVEKISIDDPCWQAKYYAFNLYSRQKAKEKLNQKHMNPVTAGPVDRAVDWRWSSARRYLLKERSAVPLEWIF